MRILAAVLATATLSACLCKDPSSPACRALNVVVSCTSQPAPSAIAALIAGLVPALGGQKIDWGAVATLEEQYGTQAVACAIQKLLGTPALSPDDAALREHAAEYLSRRRVVFVK